MQTPGEKFTQHTATLLVGLTIVESELISEFIKKKREKYYGSLISKIFSLFKLKEEIEDKKRKEVKTFAFIMFIITKAINNFIHY